MGLQEAHAMFLDRGFQRLCHVPDEPVGDVDECDDLPPFQNQEPVVDAGLPSDSQPEVAGHQASTDDGGLLGLDQGYGHPGILQQEVFTEEALGEFPVALQVTGLFHQRMDPGETAGGVSSLIS